MEGALNLKFIIFTDGGAIRLVANDAVVVNYYITVYEIRNTHHQMMLVDGRSRFNRHTLPKSLVLLLRHQYGDREHFLPRNFPVYQEE